MSAQKIVVRVLLGLLALLLLGVGLVVLIATTPWGQQVVTRQVNKYLTDKIKSPFHIGHVGYSIPDYLELQDVLFITPKGDTLLNGAKMRVDLDMWGLLHNRVSINQVELERVSVNVNRNTPDSTFNFQYIINAFDTGAKPEPSDTVSTPMEINLSKIGLRQVRIRYRDDYAGTDLDAYVDTLQARLRKTDVYTSQYYLRDVNADGLRLAMRVYDGTDTTTSTSADTLDLQLGNWNLVRPQWNIRVENSDFRTQGSARQLSMVSDHFYLEGEKLGFKTLALRNGDVQVALTVPKPKPKPAGPPSSKPGWQIRLGQLAITDSRIRYDDETEPRQKKGLDYSHLDLQRLTADGRNLLYQDLGSRGQWLNVRLQEAKLRSSSGLVVQKLMGDLLYTDTTTTVNRLYVQTPTSLLRDQLVLRYDSLGQLTNPRFAHRVGVKVNLKQSHLSVADALQIAPWLATTPPFDGNPNDVFRFNTTATGTLAALNVPRFELAMLGGTRLVASGRLTNVTDPNRMGVDMTIQDGVTTLADINRLVPKGTIPESVALPPTLRLKGRFKGLLNDLTLNAQLLTDWGTAAFDGRVSGFVAGKNQTYKGTLDLTDFDAGKWTKQPQQLGKITGRAIIDGRGIDLKTMHTTFDLAIRSAEINGYRYQNFDGAGNLENGLLALKGKLNDPNATVAVDIRTDLTQDYPSITGTTTVGQLNLQALGFYKDPLLLKGNIKANIVSTDPARPIGTIEASDATLTLNGKEYPIDSLYARLSAQGNTKTVLAKLPGANMRLSGQFDYARLYDILAGEIGQYLAIPDLTYKPVTTPYSVAIDATAYQNPLFRAFVPELTRLDTVKLHLVADKSRDTSLVARVRTGTIIYDSIRVNKGAMDVWAAGGKLNLNSRVAGINAQGTTIGPTTLTGVAAANQMDFGLTGKDSIDQVRHQVLGKLNIVDSSYRVSLAPDGMFINYQPWTANPNGYAQYGKDGLYVNNVHIQSGVQALEVSSTEPYGNAPLRVTAHTFELKTLMGLAGADTTMTKGELNGTVVVRDYLSADSKLAFIGSVYVDSLQVMKQPIGNLTARFRNMDDGRIDVNTVLAGPYNDATVTGFYNPDDAKAPIDLAIKLNRLDARTIEAFSFGELRQAKGKLTGEFTVKGSSTDPKLNGQVAFDSVAFNVKQLNATYFIDRENLALSGQTITLKDFNLRDSQNRILTANGTIVLQNLPDASYDLYVKANNFQVLNASRKDNNYGYGQAAVTADLRIRGSGTSPSIMGRVKVEDGSKVTAVVPDETLDINEANEIVTFINPKDSLTLARYLYVPKADSVKKRITFDQLDKATISVDVEVDEKSELTIVVDELNGDYLRTRGVGELNVTVNASGDMSVLGRYDITEGEYSMTYQVLKRQFEIQKGGYIQFTGDPLKATINVTALYNVSASPSDLIGNEVTTAGGSSIQRKLPFVVALTIGDNIASPKLDFDIRLDDRAGNTQGNALGTAVTAKLQELRRDQSQINKQVFALLVLNRFLPENTADFFSGSTGGGLGTQAENIARSSVSKLITDQLGQLASNVLKGFDVDFNLLSQSGSSATGGTASGARTDLNVGLSKSFLEGRLTVAIGRNFVLENTAGTATRNPNEVFDNVSINYALSRDGRYMLRAYRKNDYQAILDGYIIETGVGFIITVDYNNLRDLMRRSPGSPAAN